MTSLLRKRQPHQIVHLPRAFLGNEFIDEGMIAVSFLEIDLGKKHLSSNNDYAFVLIQKQATCLPCKGFLELLAFFYS